MRGSRVAGGSSEALTSACANSFSNGSRVNSAFVICTFQKWPFLMAPGSDKEAVVRRPLAFRSCVAHLVNEIAAMGFCCSDRDQIAPTACRYDLPSLDTL